MTALLQLALQWMKTNSMMMTMSSKWSLVMSKARGCEGRAAKLKKNECEAAKR